MEQTKQERPPEASDRFWVGKTPVRVIYGGQETLSQCLTAYFTARRPDGTCHGQT